MSENKIIFLKEPSNRSSIIAMDLFWLGFIIYITSSSISVTGQVNYVMFNLFQILGLLFMLPSAAYVIQFKTNNEYLKITYTLYCCWLMGIVIRGIRFDYQFIKQMLFETNLGILPYFVPLILLFPISIPFLKKLFNVIVILSVFYLFFNLLFFKTTFNPLNDSQSRGVFEKFTQHLSLSAGFLILTYIYHNRTKGLFALVVLILTFIFSTIRARRGLMFISFNILIFAYILYQYINKARVLSIIISFFIITITTFVAIRVYENNRKDTFSLVSERLTQQTRSGVEQYFYNDLDLKEWIIGKGMNGQYFCPGVEEGVGHISLYRNVIETGFLQIVLNGGLISLVLLIIISLPAIIKGLFSSKNILSKASAIWIIIFFLYMYPGTPAIFSLNYILVWVSIGICYSSELRNIPENTMKEIFTGKKTISSEKDLL